MVLVLKVGKFSTKWILEAAAWHLVSVSESLHRGSKKSLLKVKPPLQWRPKDIGNARTMGHLPMKAVCED